MTFFDYITDMAEEAVAHLCMWALGPGAVAMAVMGACAHDLSTLSWWVCFFGSVSLSGFAYVLGLLYIGDAELWDQGKVPYFV